MNLQVLGTSRQVIYLSLSHVALVGIDDRIFSLGFATLLAGLHISRTGACRLVFHLFVMDFDPLCSITNPVQKKTPFKKHDFQFAASETIDGEI